MLSTKASARIDRLLNDGQRLFARGQFGSARNRFREITKLAPNDPRGFFFLGSVLLAEKDAFGALAPLKVAAGMAPDNVEVIANLGLAQAETGDRSSALEALNRALALRPEDSGIRLNLANVLIDERRADEALTILATAEENSAVLLSRAHALIALGRPAEALTVIDTAQFREPESFEILIARRLALQRAGQIRAAIDVGWQLIRAGDPDGTAYLGIASDQARLGDSDGAARTLDLAIAAGGGDETAPADLIQLRAARQLYSDAEDVDGLNRLHKAAGKRLEQASPFQKFENQRDPLRPLRIGFVSPDFRVHSVMSFFMGPLANIDRDNFAIFLYGNVEKSDVVTERVRGSAVQYRDVFKIPPAQIARMIRADKIDILIDLAGHMAGNLLEVFARRPAPLQMTWLGYPYSTGLKRIHWRLTDASADPPALQRNDYSEELFRLKHFLCFSPIFDVPLASSRQDVGPIVFGSFNNLDKYDGRTLAHWVKIMARMPESRLIVRQSALRHEEVRATWHRRFVDGGIAPDRLDMGPFDDRAPNAQFTIHDEVDICLDPLGYNGTTTTCNALWMGVPVIVTPGRAHAARVGVSIMAAAGIPEFVARDPEDAVEKIVELAANRSRLADYRRTLRERIAKSPLCDSASFARDFEAALRKTWTAWCADEG